MGIFNGDSQVKQGVIFSGSNQNLNIQDSSLANQPLANLKSIISNSYYGVGLKKGTYQEEDISLMHIDKGKKRPRSSKQIRSIVSGTKDSTEPATLSASVGHVMLARRKP